MDDSSPPDEIMNTNISKYESSLASKRINYFKKFEKKEEASNYQ